MAENKNGTGRLAPPRHIAIIMDGNGRWAKKRGLPRTAGHKEGAETFRRIATYCKDIGVKYLTVYAFSTENWKRSETEVAAIMALLKKYLLEAVDTMERDHIRPGRPTRSRNIFPRTISRPTSASTTAGGMKFSGRRGGLPRTAPPGDGARRT